MWSIDTRRKIRENWSPVIEVWEKYSGDNQKRSLSLHCYKRKDSHTVCTYKIFFFKIPIGCKKKIHSFRGHVGRHDY